jgi:hypothetical protein
LCNALDYVPRRVDDDCLQELRWLYDRRDLSEARRDLAAWLAKWSVDRSGADDPEVPGRDAPFQRLAGRRRRGRTDRLPAV